MDLLAQSMDPYSAQKSMDCADICGSLRVVACAVRGKYSPACQRYYRTRVYKCNFSCNISGQFALYVWSTIPTYQSGAKRKCVIIVILRQVPALSACREVVPTPTVCDFVPWIVEAHKNA